MQKITWATVAGISLTILSGCNIFSPIDSPSGDEQYLSKARACFDQGDFDCALENYGHLSTGGMAETAVAETAFLTLARNGAPMSEFINDFGDGNGALGVTNLATHFAQSGAANVTTRLALKAAHDTLSQIPNNAPLRGLVRFVTSATLIAEILGENAGVNGISSLEKTDVIKSTGCVASNCALDANCAASVGSVIIDSAAPASISGSFSGSPTTQMLVLLVSEVNTALSSELGASGKFQTLINLFSSISGLSGFGPGSGPCVRAAFMITGGVGN